MTTSDPLDAMAGFDPLDGILGRDAPLDVFDTRAALDAVLDPALRQAPPAVEERESTGSFAGDTARELSDLEQGIKDRKKAERDRFRAATDSEYWVALCFTSRSEKTRFLERAGLLELGDKYLDGRIVAAALDVDMTPPPVD